MRTDIHPEYVEATVRCACGHRWTTRSTKPELRLDICSKCHPFYTGEQRIVDTAGQVERFMKRMEAASGKPSKRQVRLAARAERDSAGRQPGEDQAETEADLVGAEAAAN